MEGVTCKCRNCCFGIDEGHQPHPAALVVHTGSDLWCFLSVRGQNPWKHQNTKGNSGLDDILLIPSNSVAEGRMCLYQPRPNHSGHFPASKGEKFPVFHLFLPSKPGGIRPEELQCKKCSLCTSFLPQPLWCLSVPPRAGRGPWQSSCSAQGELPKGMLCSWGSVLAHFCVWTLWMAVPGFRGWIWGLWAQGCSRRGSWSGLGWKGAQSHPMGRDTFPWGSLRPAKVLPKGAATPGILSFTLCCHAHPIVPLSQHFQWDNGTNVPCAPPQPSCPVSLLCCRCWPCVLSFHCVFCVKISVFT